MRFCDFVEEYIERYYKTKKRRGTIPFQNKGHISWYYVFVDDFSNYVIKAYKYPIAIGYTCISTSRINKGACSNFKVLDKVNMNLYGAKIQEVYA